MLNEKLIVKYGSKGFGVFAYGYIKKGSVIWSMQKENYFFDKPNQDKFFQIYSSREHDGRFHIATDECMFLNHSCSPNLIPIGLPTTLFLITGRDILKGEELTYDYSIEPDNPMSREFQCKCASSECRGRIT